MPGRDEPMSNKASAEAFLKLASCGRVREAYDKYVHPEFRHHNAYFRGDRQTLLEGMEENARQFPGKTYETLRMVEDGDHVAIHGRVTFGGSQWSVIHIFRFKAGKIIEEWEASQQVLKDSPNENGIF
jgi:predicted SnoaL-like aldol condensation-catalyzing enzyme